MIPDARDEPSLIVSLSAACVSDMSLGNVSREKVLDVALRDAAPCDMRISSEESPRHGFAAANTTAIPKAQQFQPLSIEISDTDLNSSQLGGLED